MSVELGEWSGIMWTAYGSFRVAGEKKWRWDGKRWRLIKQLPYSLRDGWPIVDGQYAPREELL